MTLDSTTHASIYVEGVKSDVENREARKLAGICVRRYCGKPSKDDSDYCAKHHEKQLVYQREYMERCRLKWDKAGVCTRCGGRRKPNSQWCARCLIRQSKVPHSELSSHVENRRDRIASRLIPWANSPTNANRVRLRGGKRGVPPRSQTDQQDRLDVTKGIATGFDGLAMISSPEFADFPRAEKRRAEMAALDHLASAVRFLEEVLDRHHYDAEIAGTPRKIRG